MSTSSLQTALLQ